MVPQGIIFEVSNLLILFRYQGAEKLLEAFNASETTTWFSHTPGSEDARTFDFLQVK